MRSDSEAMATDERRPSIPIWLRCMPVQIAAIVLFGVGAVIGAVAEDGRVLSDFGVYKIRDLPEVIGLFSVIFAVLALLTSITRPLQLKFQALERDLSWRLTVAWGYILVALVLMTYNWLRLDVINLLQDNPGAIAFRFSEEGGAVLLYTTMLCIFIGSSYILDHARGRMSRWLVVGSLVIFAVGLLGMTRREMLLLLILWFAVHLSTSRGRLVKYALLSLLPLLLVALYFSMLVRGIDMLEDPLAYFSSGEFEPFRYALFLGGEWLRDPVFMSPWPYAFPMAGGNGLVGSVNGFFSGRMFGDVNALGYPTVTMFSTVIYFGGLVPLLFFVISVFMVKQAEYWFNLMGGYCASFMYAFVLLRMILFIRNGELFATLLDTLVLACQFILFYFLIARDVVVMRVSRGVR